MYKRLRKLNGQSIMDNQEILAILDTQDTGRRQTKHDMAPKIKMMSRTGQSKHGVNTGALEG